MEQGTKEIINSINSNRVKIYYQLNQLKDVTGMSIRSLKYRMKDVKVKYDNIPTLLNKDGNKWNIHYTIINEFLPKYKKTQTYITNHSWETLVSWYTKDNYDYNYHIQLIKEVKDELPIVNIGYIIETDGHEVNHVHAVTDGFKDEVTTAVSAILNKYLDPYQYRYQVEKINNIGSVIYYLKKNKKMKEFDLEKFNEEMGFNFKLQPYNYEKYKSVNPNLTENMYSYLRENGTEWKILCGCQVRIKWEIDMLKRNFSLMTKNRNVFLQRFSSENYLDLLQQYDG